MKEFFEDVFRYNHLVNDKIIEVLILHKEKLNLRTQELMNHILLVHQSWNRRMMGMDGLGNIWQSLPLDDLAALNSNNLPVTLDIIKQYELEVKFSYSNSKGASFTNTYRDVLFHLVNHSSYHRGQINAELRRVGVEPVIADYIFYKR